ncbi:MAG: helix-turn-helix domain-containing protein [Smithellaceae bacterium]|jgi:lambda repressor-like predicted transcriptional regulator
MRIKKNPVSIELWSWIKHRLLTEGYPSFRALGKAYRYSDGAFKNVKNYAYPKIEKIIADIVGMKPQDLFSNRYDVNGKPIGRNYPRSRRITKRKSICNIKTKRSR